METPPPRIVAEPVAGPGDYKLKIELVPERAWGLNLRAVLKASEWKKIKEWTFERAGSRCEICGKVGRKHPVECHEIWAYEENQRVMRLVGLQALCPLCHLAKHYGFAEKQDLSNAVIAHLATVNGISPGEAAYYAKRSIDGQRRRSKMAWRLNLDWFEERWPGWVTPEKIEKAKAKYQKQRPPAPYVPPRPFSMSSEPLFQS